MERLGSVGKKISCRNDRKIVQYMLLIIVALVILFLFLVQPKLPNSVPKISTNTTGLSLFYKAFNDHNGNGSRSSHLLYETILMFVPQLHVETFSPKLYVSSKKAKVKFLFGIPTVKRAYENYLMGEIESMLTNAEEETLKNSLFLIFIGESEPEIAHGIASELMSKFKPSIDKGIFEIISPDGSFYPQVWDLVESKVDSKNRLIWRTKQNIDYIYLWAYSYVNHDFDYFIQMEDDVIAKKSYIRLMERFISTQKRSDWLMLKVCALGFIGNIFHKNTIAELSVFFAMFYKNLPCDWIIGRYLSDKVCSPAEPGTCEKQMAKVSINREVSLFQHMGQKSSLKGKLQPAKDRTFDKKEIHINPPANIKSNFSTVESNNFENLYFSNEKLSAKTPIPAGTFFKIEFPIAIQIAEIKLDFGNKNQQKEILQSFIIEGALLDSEKVANDTDIKYKTLSLLDGQPQLNIRLNEKYKIIRFRALKNIPQNHIFFTIESLEVHL